MPQHPPPTGIEYLSLSGLCAFQTVTSPLLKFHKYSPALDCVLRKLGYLQNFSASLWNSGFKIWPHIRHRRRVRASAVSLVLTAPGGEGRCRSTISCRRQSPAVDRTRRPVRWSAGREAPTRGSYGISLYLYSVINYKDDQK